MPISLPGFSHGIDLEGDIRPAKLVAMKQSPCPGGDRQCSVTSRSALQADTVAPQGVRLVEREPAPWISFVIWARGAAIPARGPTGTLGRVTTPPDSPFQVSCDAATRSSDPSNAGCGSSAPGKLAALATLQPTTRNLLSVWLAEQQWEVVDFDRLQRVPDVIIVEVSYPRTESPAQFSRLADGYPAVPIVLISPMVVSGTPSRGDVARQLGVAAVLAMPLRRGELLATIHELTSRG